MQKMFMYVSGLLLASVAFANPVQSWLCSAKSGFMGNQITSVRLQRSSSGYAVYLTDSSDDTGPQWDIKNELVVDGLTCTFSATLVGPLDCSFQNGNSWDTLLAEDSQLISVDTKTGKDQVLKATDIVLSGTSETLKHYSGSVLRFSATSCSRD